MADSPVVRLAENVWRIPTMPFDGINSFALVEDDGQVTLVDCGMKGAPRKIVAGLAAIGKAPSDVSRILLTHAHFDHAGGAAELSRRSGAVVGIHEGDLPYTTTGRMPDDYPGSRMGRFLLRLPYNRFAPPELGEPLIDGQLLPVAGGLRVLHTPGHTPGHVSLLHEPTGVLITGDAMANLLGVRWPLSFVCSDPATNRRSARRFADLDFTIAAFTHGPELRNRARERVRSFLTSG